MNRFNLRIESLVIESARRYWHRDKRHRVSISELRVLLLRGFSVNAVSVGSKVSISELRVLLLRDVLLFGARDAMYRIDLGFNLRIESLVIESRVPE